MSTSIADALATFTKSVLQTQADIECRAQAEVGRAIDDAFKARNERDEAVRRHHSMQLEVQKMERANDICKAEIQRAESKIAQQAQLIAKLEQQSSQLEQQSRSWQDHSQTWEKNYLRVEQERLDLIRKVEELTRRLQRPPPSLLTPVSRQEEPTIKNRDSTSSRRKLISPSDTESPLQHPPHRNLTKPKSVKEETETRTTATRAPVTPASTQKPPNPVATRLIRRVQAVIHVKQEDSDEDLGASEHSTRPAKTPRKRSIVADEPQSSDSGQSAEADEDEDDEDDPIMMGAQPPRNIHQSTLKSVARTTRPATPPNKKRKIVATTTRRK